MLSRVNNKVNLLLLLSASVFASGCGHESPSSFRGDQFTRDAPCWQVDLNDGLSEESTSELVNLYDCFNQDEAFQSFSPLVDHLSDPQEAEPLGLEVSRLFNNLDVLELDLPKLIKLGLDLIKDHSSLVIQLESFIFEAIYGSTLAEPPTDIASSSELDNGLLKQALGLIQPVSSFAVSSDDFIAESQQWEPLDALKDILCTTMSLSPLILDTNPDFAQDFSDFFSKTQDDSNDQWALSTGDSLRDWITLLFVQDGQIITEIQPSTYQLLSDTRIRPELIQLLETHTLNGNLEEIPNGLMYLLSVDAQGGVINGNDQSAFFHIMRLLDHSNQPLECSIDFLGVPLTQFEVDNFGVELLTRLSESDAQSFENAIGLLFVLDWNITQFTLDAIIAAGICPIFTNQFMDDLVALERLTDSPSMPLFEVGVESIQFLKSNTDADNRLYEVVDILSTVHSSGLTPPTEELMKDVLRTELTSVLIENIPNIIDSPPRSDDCPTNSNQIDINGGLDLISELLDPNQNTLSVGLPFVNVLVDEDDTWLLLNSSLNQIENPDFMLNQPLDLLKDYMAVDPELEIIGTFGVVYRQDTLRNSTLRLMSDPQTIGHLQYTESSTAGPLPMIGAWIQSGTIDDILQLMEWVILPLYSD